MTPATIRSRFSARPFSNTLFVFGPQTATLTFAFGLSEKETLLFFAPRFTRAKDAGIVDDGLEWPNRVGLLGEGAGFLDAGQVAGERRLTARNGMHGVARSIAVASMQHNIVS